MVQKYTKILNSASILRKKAQNIRSTTFKTRILTDKGETKDCVARMRKNKLCFAMHLCTTPSGSPVFTGNSTGVYQTAHYTQTIHQTYTKKAEHRHRCSAFCRIFMFSHQLHSTNELRVWFGHCHVTI